MLSYFYILISRLEQYLNILSNKNRNLMYSFRNTILLVLLKICGIGRSQSNSYPDSVKEGNKETREKNCGSLKTV